MILRNRSIKLKIIFITALSSSIALVAFSCILFFYEMTFVKKELISNLQTQVEIIAENSLASLAFMDDSTTRKTLGALKHNPDILYAGLYNAQQQLLDAYHAKTFQGKMLLQSGEFLHSPLLYEAPNFIQITHPIYLNNELLGFLVLHASFDSFNQKLNNYMTIILGAFCTTLLIALYLSLNLQRLVSRPIIQIADFIHHVTESKSYDEQVVKESNDEFGRLVDAFNEMLRQLNLSFKQRDEAEDALSHHLNHLQEIVDEQTLDLQTALKAADAANHSKSEFLANMSHEIRTPMNAIMGMTNLAQRTNLTGKQRDYLEKIDTATQSLLTIINDILDFSKIEAGKMTIENIPFSLNKVLVHLLDMLKFKAKQKNILLHFSVSPEVPHFLIGDSLRLGQILLNLLSNAVKFTEQGEVALTVDLKSISESIVELNFSVRDTGIGMSNKQIDSLFRPFSQADSSTTRKYGGTGLGLTICKQLAELMDGEIQVASAYGHGSTFTFNVKLSYDSANLQAINDENEQAISVNSHYSAQRILLIEDNEINQQVAFELLTSMGLQVQIANNGQEGLNRVLAEKFDLVFMDIQMPIMDGLTATRFIRREKSLANLPIIAMTAHAMQGDKEKSLAVGMNDHLTKPIELNKLIAVLNRWLQLDTEIVIPTQKLKVKKSLLPDDLPPFDLALALKFTGEDPRLLHQLLLRFSLRYANSTTQLVQWIETKEFDQIQHLAHSIKGVAGTLAAHQLKIAADELEFALHCKQFDNFDELVSNLKNTLNVALQAIALLPPLPVETNDGDYTLNTNELSELLAQFQILLRSNHFNATELFEQLKSPLRLQGFEQEIKELASSLDELDFQSALLVVNKINLQLSKGK